MLDRDPFLRRLELTAAAFCGGAALVALVVRHGTPAAMATWRADERSAVREITLLRLRALLARARGDDVAYRDLVNRYRAMAESLGFEGHIAWAEAMP